MCISSSFQVLRAPKRWSKVGQNTFWGAIFNRFVNFKGLSADIKKKHLNQTRLCLSSNQPIISANCYACHATAATAGGGLDLQDTASLKSYLNYSFRGDNIYGSKFYHCVLHSSLALPMPPTTVLDTCSIKKIHHWLLAGAPVQ